MSFWNERKFGLLDRLLSGRRKMANTRKIGGEFVPGWRCEARRGKARRAKPSRDPENVEKLSCRKGCRNLSAMPLLFHLTPRPKVGGGNHCI